MKILDATCGEKGMWYQKSHPFVTFLDKRNGIYGKNKHKIKPDIVATWDDMPFPNNCFDVVIFDPPHIICNAETGNIVSQYGHFKIDTWKQELKTGIANCFRVLKPNGIFIFKWAKAERYGHSIPIEDVLPMFPFKPLFGTRTGKRDTNHWIVFLKHRLEKELDIN